MPVAGSGGICYYIRLKNFRKFMSKVANQGSDAETGAEVPAPPAPLTAAEIEELKTRAAKADENWERLLRTTADFENFKKRAAREKNEAVQYANGSLLEKILPVLDNFEAALAAAKGADGAAGNVNSLQSGVAMIQMQLKNVLLNSGLEEIDATGQKFDPTLHEAVSQQESTEVPEDQVIQQLRKGYKLKDRLLRPATVVVAKKPAAKA